MSYFNLQEKIEEINPELNDCSDFAYRFFKKQGQEVALIFLKSISIDYKRPFWKRAFEVM